MAPSGDDRHYQPQNAVGDGVNGALVFGAAGLFASAIQNALARRNVGAWGVFTRTGGTIAVFTAAGGSYRFVRAASANLREKEDSYNTAIAGFVAGAAIGISRRRLAPVLGWGVLTSVAMAVYDYTGSSLAGGKKDAEVDEFERKEYLRKLRRRPVEETLENLGGDRLLHSAGYEDRRRERLRQKYGIEVNPVSADPSA